MQRSVSEEPLSKANFTKIVKSVINLLGFFKDVTIYAIRRYVGKQINGRWSQGFKSVQSPFF